MGKEVGTSVTNATGSLVDRSELSRSIGKKYPRVPTPITATQRQIIEIETAHGCDIGKCSFCTEPIKHKLEFREKEDILEEIKAFYDLGARYFRLGKQSCFYTLPYAVEICRILIFN